MPRFASKLFHPRKSRTPEKDAASKISEPRSEPIDETSDPTTGQGQVSAPTISDSQGVINKTKSLNFWQEAYEEILGDEDEEIKKILAAYDVLLERAARTDGGIASSNATLLTDAQTQGADVGFRKDRSSAEEDIGDSSSSELSDSDIRVIPSARRLVGDDEKMRVVVTIKLEEMQQKEWVLKWHGHVFKVREEVTRIVGIVQKISGFASQTAALNPYSGLAWAGVCVLLPMITNDTDERQIAIDGVSKATELVARYKIVEEDYLAGKHGKHEDFEKVLVAMYRKITLFYIKAACYFARSTLKRILRGVAVLDDWKSTLASLTKADEECQSFVISLGLSASLKKGDQILEKLSRIETSNQIDRIKAWLLSDVDVDKQHLDKQDKLGSEFRNSGRWLLDSSEFKEWEDSTSAHLWISGPVGTGKTSLVSIVVNSLRSLGIENVACFYYSVDTSKTLQTPNTISRLEQIFRGLVGQLAMAPDKARVAEEVEIAFEKALKHGTLQPAPLGWEGAKSLLINIIASRRNSTIIIDGIDEFPVFKKLLNELKAIHDAVKPGQLRLLLASQTVVPVSEYFPSAILMVAGGEKSKPDMNAFIRRRVELFRREHPKALTQEVADDMVKTLSENAEGMFKWADLCLKRVLYDDDRLHIQENWESVKRQHFRGLLVGLVASYDQLYQKEYCSGYSERKPSWVSAYDSHVSDSTAAPDPLYYATLLGYTNIVKLLLGSGVGPKTGGHLGQTLQLAAFQGKTAIVRKLLGEGFDINQTDEVLGTPLQAAIAGGQRELVEILMDEYSADVNASGESFGNALQMALALQDQDLVTSLHAHGAGHKEPTRRDRIWDNAWRSAQALGLDVDRTINVLRKTSSLTPKLPNRINRRLKVLAICIHHRREIMRHQNLAGYLEHVWRSKRPLRAKIDKEGTWQKVVEIFRDTEVATLGFIPTTFTWLLLIYYQFGINVDSFRSDSKVLSDVDTTYKILSRHETFIRTFPENVPILQLEKILTNLFRHIISGMFYVAGLHNSLTRVNKFALFFRSNMKLDSEEMSELQHLHKDAMVAEDNARSMETLNLIIPEYNDRTTSELKEMRREITDLKADIGELTQKMDLLLSLLKPLQS
ncbi:ankyrin repeat-containing protein [Fusarium bulbicola]|nr:ankyrin repeat-containing protein [Fusarium bulbicola]